jgi:uridine kinase
MIVVRRSEPVVGAHPVDATGRNDAGTDRPRISRPALLERLADLIAGRRQSHPVRVAIDGVDAAGKTTLAEELIRPLAARGRPVLHVPIDGFHLPRAHRYRRGELSPEGYYHESFDYPAFRANLLDPLGPSGDRRYRTAIFDVSTDQPRVEPPMLAPSDAVLVCDGVFLLRPELDGAWDVRLFLEVSLREALRRAVVRDRARFGSARAARHRYRRRYLPGQRLYLAGVHPERIADVVVDNQDPAAPSILTIRLDEGADSMRASEIIR